MIVNQLNLTGSNRLNQIMHTLKHVHRFELSAHERLNLAETQQHYESVKQQIVENSAFNSYHTNPEYTKAALITEAVKLLKEIAPSRRKTVKEHQELAESMNEDKKVSQVTYKEGDKVKYTDSKGKTTDCIVAQFTKGPMIGLKINGKIDMVPKSQVRHCSVDENRLVKSPLKEASNMTVAQLAAVSDEALDKAYGYGRSTPSNTFGWQANLKSAEFAKKIIDSGVTDIEKISDAVHKGWNQTAMQFVQNPDQFDDTKKLKDSGKLEAKLAQREKLMKINYAQLPEDEKEKDRVVARALLSAIKGSVAESFSKYSLKEASKQVKDLLAYTDTSHYPMPDRYEWNVKGIRNITTIFDDPRKYNLKDIYAGAEKGLWKVENEDDYPRGNYTHVTVMQPNNIEQFLNTVYKINPQQSLTLTEARKRPLGHNRKVMMEDESLDKAETILAAKDLSDKLQNMAEDAAKMAVDKLMPLVDVMKSQFGQDPADGFNSVVKAQLQSVLDAIITAKDETDNAILALQGGETPSMPTDISQPLPSAEPSVDGAAPDEFGVDQEFSAGPETAGPEQEPLGRGMKSTMNESKFAVGDNVEFDYAKNMKPVKGKVVAIVPVKKTSQNPYGIMYDVKLENSNTIYSLHPDHPQKLMESINNKQDHKDLVADAAEAAMTGKDKKGRPVNQKAAQETLKTLTNMKEAAKKSRSPYAIGTAKAMELTGDTPPLKKSTITKAHEIARSIEKDTQKESKINNLKVVIESLKTEFNNLKREFNAQCEIHKQSVMEGTVMDVTQVGYGLEGAAILQKMNNVKNKIQETQERVTALVQQVQEQHRITHMTKTKMSALSEQAQTMPYGVIGTDLAGTKFKKFFESADHRQLWLEYNQSSLAHKQMINPEDLERIRHRLKGTI